MRWLEILRDVAPWMAVPLVVGAFTLLFVWRIDVLAKRYDAGTWTAEDTWAPLPDADVTALAEAVGVLPDPASRTPVYEAHRQPPMCGETWDDEVGCSLSSGHRCVKLGAHSTHRCFLCGSLVIEEPRPLDGAGDEFLEPVPTQREIAVGAVMGQCCPDHVGMCEPEKTCCWDCPTWSPTVVSAPLISAGAAPSPQPEAETWVTVGRGRVHTRCRDARRDKRPVVDGCAEWLGMGRVAS